jgi:type IV pilus assembly protein PilB
MLSLEEMLLKEGAISKSRLEEASWLAKRKGSRLLETLLSVGFVAEEEIAQMFVHQGACARADFSSGIHPVPDQNLDGIISCEFASKNNVLPLFRSLNSLLVAVVDPLDMELIYELEKIVGVPVKTLVASRSQLKKAIKEFYGQ